MDRCNSFVVTFLKVSLVFRGSDFHLDCRRTLDPFESLLQYQESVASIAVCQIRLRCPTYSAGTHASIPFMLVP